MGLVPNMQSKDALAAFDRDGVESISAALPREKPRAPLSDVAAIVGCIGAVLKIATMSQPVFCMANTIT